MTTNFRVRIRREHDSDERCTRREHARILTHISSVRRVCERAPTHDFAELGILFVYTLRVQEYTIASNNAYISFLKFSLHILEQGRVICLLNVYAFESFICFGLIGFPFHMGSILRSIYEDYRSLLFDKPPSRSL